MAAVGIPDYRLPRDVLRRGGARRVPRRQDRLQLPLRRRRHHGAAVRAGLRGESRRRRAAHQSARMGCEGEDVRVRGLHARASSSCARSPSARRRSPVDHAGHRRRQRRHGLRPLGAPIASTTSKLLLTPHRGGDAGRPGRDRRGQGGGRRDGHPRRAEPRIIAEHGRSQGLSANACSSRARRLRPAAPSQSRDPSSSSPRLHRPGHRPGVRCRPARAEPHRGEQVEDPRGRPAQPCSPPNPRSVRRETATPGRAASWRPLAPDAAPRVYQQLLLQASSGPPPRTGLEHAMLEVVRTEASAAAVHGSTEETAATGRAAGSPHPVLRRGRGAACVADAPAARRALVCAVIASLYGLCDMTDGRPPWTPAP